jgi:hypothetical protein
LSAQSTAPQRERRYKPGVREPAGSPMGMGLPNPISRMVAPAVGVLLALALALPASASALTESSFVEPAEAKPTLTASGEALEWDATDPTKAYLLRRTIPGRNAEYALVKKTDARPPSVLGQTVGYRVKPVTGGSWSAEASITYPSLSLEETGLPTLTEEAFVTRAETRPGVTVSGEALSWEAVDLTGAYLLKRSTPGSEDEYALVKKLRVRPPAIPGQTVVYRVKGVTGGSWSAEVSIAYPTEDTEPAEGSGGDSIVAGGSAVVNSTPTGPPAPRSGWHVAFADGFGAPLGIGPGEDNFWYPNRFCCDPSEYQKGFNKNELEVFSSSQVRVGGEGLELIDTYKPNVGGTGKNYVSGTVNTDLKPPPGYHLFRWKPGYGETWAFECVCRLPRNTGEEDPGWWSSNFHWKDEFDFFEFWGWNTADAYDMGVAWIWKVPDGVIEADHDVGKELDVSGSFHRYTTVINPNNSVEEYIDGVRQSWLGKNGVLGPPPEVTIVSMGLKLSNALRVNGSHFTSGSRVFTIRSIAVYEDGEHAGKQVRRGGVAPGTVMK